MYEKEAIDYAEERSESGQSIVALEAAVKILTGAGTGKKGLLETSQQAHVLNVVAGVRGTLRKPAVLRSASDKDFQRKASELR